MTGLYLMHTRECYNANIEVYKLGRSKTLDNRVKQYPNGSKILFMINCINSILLESILIKLFKTKYVQQTLYGTEYFLGNQKEMIKDIINCILTQDIPIVLNTNTNPITNTNTNTNTNPITNINTNTNTNTNNNTNTNIPNKQNTNYIKTQNNIVFNNKNCPKCNSEFKYPSMLRTHLNRAFHCLSTKEEIDIFFNNNNNINKCIKCNKSFNNLQAHKRHLKETKCGKSQL